MCRFTFVQSTTLISNVMTIAQALGVTMQKTHETVFIFQWEGNKSPYIYSISLGLCSMYVDPKFHDNR